MRHLFALILLTLLTPSAPAEGVRIATYNVRNYLAADRLVDGRWRPGYPKPEAEKRALREIIRSESPDILVLQEIGPAPYLEELRLDLAEEGLAYPSSHLMQGADDERHTALLSRIAPLEVVAHHGLDFKYLDGRIRVKRGLLEAVFPHPDGGVWKLFTVHLKSRHTSDRRDPESALRRAREAEACRDRVVERTFDAGVERFVVAGDFNDHPDSAALRRFRQRGDLAISRALPAADSRGEVWTHFYAKQGLYSQVDYVLVSARWSAVAEARVVDRTGALDASDHRMVVVDLQLEPAEETPPPSSGSCKRSDPAAFEAWRPATRC